MAQTFWDLAQHDRDTTWRLIRQLRSRSGDLRRSDAAVFAAALEQSEQLLVAARSVGTATRAIPLYYGLTQACRAIALTIQPGAWFGSHGVKTNEGSLRGSKTVSLKKLTIRGMGQPTSGFGLMSQLLDSPQMLTAQPLDHLWGMAIETQIHEPRFPASHPSLLVQEDGRDSWLVTGILTTSGALEEQHFTAMQHHYPDLQGATFQGFSPVIQDQADRPVCHLSVAKSDGSGNLLPLGTPYRRSVILMPGIISNQARTLHPLMLWWALLHPLSILSRYEPATWAHITDVDASPLAIHIEALMDEALDAVPAIVYQTLHDGLNRST